MSDDSRDIESKLTSLGVRPDVATYVASQPPSILPNSGILMIVVMVAGFAVGALYLWPALEQLTINNALRHARDVGAILYHENFGFSMIVLLFGWICIATLIVGLLPLMSARVAAQVFAESFLGAARLQPAAANAARAGREMLREHLKDETDARRYVVRFTTSWVSWVAIAAFFLTTLSVGLAVCDVQSHTLYTREGVVRRQFFPWQSVEMRSWSDATRVEVGCNHVTGRNASDDPVYKILFRNGSTVRLDDAVPLGASWLDRVEEIDTHLNESGTLFRRWQWLDRDPLHPECLAANRARLSREDYQRLLILLRANA